MDSISMISNATSRAKAQHPLKSDETASFGAVHLNNTSIEKATKFWTTVVGLKLRSNSDSTAEFGTENQTLVVVHESATAAFREGYSGLYHFAIHLPDKQEFAKALHRLQQARYPFSPIDHTMSLSLYLTDFDNVMVELTLESPERFKRVITEGGLFMEDNQGTLRTASAPLDTDEILTHLKESDLSKNISNDAKIGHIHFYAKNVDLNQAFYKKIGFTEFNYLPKFKYADLGAGGAYKHRIAMNSWHGENKTTAPSANAGLKHYHIIFKSKEYFQKAISNLGIADVKDGKLWISDPTGIKILLSYVA